MSGMGRGSSVSVFVFRSKNIRGAYQQDLRKKLGFFSHLDLVCVCVCGEGARETFPPNVFQICLTTHHLWLELVAT